ncbi:MAG: hypothetical protein EXS37_20915 [Opitutus sp.]|nr:hypothetical protein [Opitutus sp.]
MPGAPRQRVGASALQSDLEYGQAAGVPGELITIKDGPHAMLPWPALAPDFKERVVAWLRTTLAAPAAIFSNRLSLDGLETNRWAVRSARGFSSASRICRARSARPAFELNS